MARAHQEIEVAFRAGHRAIAGLDDDDGVRGVREAILLGNHTELHLEPGGHGASRWRVWAKGSGATVWPGTGPRTAPADPGAGWQVAGLYGRPLPADAETELGRALAAGRRGERVEQLRRPQAQLLGDDRRVGLDDEGEPVDADEPAGPGRGRHALRHERRPG